MAIRATKWRSGIRLGTSDPHSVAAGDAFCASESLGTGPPPSTPGARAKIGSFTGRRSPWLASPGSGVSLVSACQASVGHAEGDSSLSDSSRGGPPVKSLFSPEFCSTKRLPENAKMKVNSNETPDVWPPYPCRPWLQPPSGLGPSPTRH